MVFIVSNLAPRKTKIKQYIDLEVLILTSKEYQAIIDSLLTTKNTNIFELYAYGN